MVLLTGSLKFRASRTVYSFILKMKHRCYSSEHEPAHPRHGAYAEQIFFFSTVAVSDAIPQQLSVDSDATNDHAALDHPQPG